MNVVLITGAAGGLGRALVGAFIGRGCGVICHYHYDPCSHRPVPVDPIIGDLESLDTINSIAEVIREQKVNILINNAGVRHCNKLGELQESEIISMINVNLVAPILLTRALIQASEGRGGLVVNINSLASKASSDGESIYATSKSGLKAFSNVIRKEAATAGIRILDAYPGAIRTRMTQNRADWDRLMDPKEVARTIVDFCVDYKNLSITEVTLVRRNN